MVLYRTNYYYEMDNDIMLTVPVAIVLRFSSCYWVICSHLTQTNIIFNFNFTHTTPRNGIIFPVSMGTMQIQAFRRDSLIIPIPKVTPRPYSSRIHSKCGTL